MNFKKTWKRANEGFTLVELIVVIAILAILAGIAVPAYSGYIKKANQAADQQVLAAVNTAFAAAVLENGEDFNKVTSAKLTGSSNGEGMTINGVTGVQGVKNADYNTAFQTYLPGGAETKVLKNFGYVPGVGFVDPSNSDSYTGYKYAGGTIYLSQADVAALAGSSFQSAGATGLMNQMGQVTTFAEGMITGTNAFATVTGSKDYQQFIAATLGVENAYDLEGDGLHNAINERMTALGMDNEEDANAVLTNGAVLYAAQNTASMSASDVTALLGEGNAKDVIKGNLASDPGTAMAQAAVAYGVYTSYCYATGNEANLEGASPLDIMNRLEDEDFLNYVNNTPSETSKWTEGQSSKDIDGYLSALNMINTSANTSNDAALDVLSKGYDTDNEELYEMLAGMIGK